MSDGTVSLSRNDDLWSGSRVTLEEAMGYFVGNESLADMTFLVGPERRRVPGHKFILISCSWDFYNALHLLHIDNDELPIQDVPYESFLVFLRYCYTREVNLGPENAGDILKFAYRFEMKALIKKCEEKILKMINGDNFMQFFSQCGSLPKDSPIKMKIMDEISVNFHRLIEIPSLREIFLDLPLKSVEEIADLKVLHCDEVKMFETLMKWSTHACEKAGLLPNPLNLRKMLDNVFFKIRFPLMTSDDFLKMVVNYPEMLSRKEMSVIYREMTDRKEVADLGVFSNIKRQKIVVPVSSPGSETREIVRTCSINSTNLPPSKEHNFRVHFEVKKQKKLVGFGLIQKQNFKINFVSGDAYFCKPCKSCNDRYKGNCSCVSRMEITPDENHDLSSDRALKDYQVFPFFFKEELTINPGGCYQVSISFKKNGPGFLYMGVWSPLDTETANLIILQTPLPILPFLYFKR